MHFSFAEKVKKRRAGTPRRHPRPWFPLFVFRVRLLRNPSYILQKFWCKVGAVGPLDGVVSETGFARTIAEG